MSLNGRDFRLNRMLEQNSSVAPLYWKNAFGKTRRVKA